MDANRPKRAARVALRAVDFCVSAGYPESAAGVPVREITKVRADVSDTTPSLVDAVLGVLCAVCSDAFARLKQPRRASRFAFFAAIRFAELRYFAAAAAAAEAIDGSALQRAAVRHHMHYWMGEGAFSQGNSVSAVRHFSSVLVEAKKSAQPNALGIHASVVRAFLRALKIGAVPKLATRWDSGAAYTLLDTAFSFVRMHDIADCDRDWCDLEDEVLEDAALFEKLANDDRRLKRERRIEALISELRYAKRSVQHDPGGSLEMKIRRMRDLAYARKRRKRAASLLERGAVLGEAVLLHTRLRNPLQFPVFIRSMSAVVSLDVKCYSLFDKSNDEAESEPPPVRLFEAPSFTIAPISEENVVLKITGEKAGVLHCIGEDGHSVLPHMWETHVADLEHNFTMKNQDKAFDTVRNITVEPETVEKFGNRDGDRWDRKAVTHFVVCSKHHSHIHRHGKGHDRPDRVYVTVGRRTNEENEGDIKIPSIDPLKWMKETKIQEHGNESVTAREATPRKSGKNNLTKSDRRSSSSDESETDTTWDLPRTAPARFAWRARHSAAEGGEGGIQGGGAGQRSRGGAHGRASRGAPCRAGAGRRGSGRYLHGRGRKRGRVRGDHGCGGRDAAGAEGKSQARNAARGGWRAAE
ncbi:hypothetical protein FGB62_26g01 [Gracilaria domingensis]|nr:hypothetical protein FGB62_26g01 [Gracilaria domingensis]